jgi:hypothetical protein
MKRFRHKALTYPRRSVWLLVLAPALLLLGGALALVAYRSHRAQPPAEMSEEQKLREQLATLTRREKFLTAELALAKSPAPYIAVDLAGRKIELKIRGRSLRSFPITIVKRSGGAPFIAQTWTGTEIKPLQTPSRARMVPGSGEATTSSIATRDPWGPKRMPGDFDLICKGDQALQIRSLPSTQSGSRFTRWIASGYRQVRDWTRDLIGRSKSAYSEYFEIWLSEDDAKLLFWSLPKQFGILILDAS